MSNVIPIERYRDNILERLTDNQKDEAVLLLHQISQVYARGIFNEPEKTYAKVGRLAFEARKFFLRKQEVEIQKDYPNTFYQNGI